MRLRELDPGAVVAFFPSDHHFADEKKFAACVELAFDAAEGTLGQVVLLGILPDTPEVSYGWIEPGSAMGFGASPADDLKSAIYDARAHEARSPLSSINIAATMLLSKRPGNAAEQREMLSIIKEKVDRMNQWIDPASRTSKADTRAFTQIAESLPTANCDGETTRHVLKLLLDNALKYTPPGTPITVSGGVDHGEIIMSVSDAGSGVPEYEQIRIFEKHCRGSGHSASVPGTGLGLASAKCPVESQGGEIWVTNRPKSGAAFHFSVPAANGVMV